MRYTQNSDRFRGQANNFQNTEIPKICAILKNKKHIRQLIKRFNKGQAPTVN